MKGSLPCPQRSTVAYPAGKPAREDQARKTEQNTKTLTVKVAPEVAEHLARLAKATKTSRTALVQEIFEDGYAKLRRAEKRIKRKERPAASVPTDPAADAGWRPGMRTAPGFAPSAADAIPPAG